MVVLSRSQETLSTIEDRLLESLASTSTDGSRSSSIDCGSSLGNSRQSLLRLSASPIHIPPIIHESEDEGGSEAVPAVSAEGGADGVGRRRRGSVLLIVVDKAIGVDNRVFAVVLLLVFVLFVFSIMVSLFMLSIYIWMK